MSVTDEHPPANRAPDRRLWLLWLPPLIWVAAAIHGGFFWRPHFQGWLAPDTALYLTEAALSVLLVALLKGRRLIASIVLLGNLVFGWLFFVMVAMVQTGISL